jgi:hypothetical protein
MLQFSQGCHLYSEFSSNMDSVSYHDKCQFTSFNKMFMKILHKIPLRKVGSHATVHTSLWRRPDAPKCLEDSQGISASVWTTSSTSSGRHSVFYTKLDFSIRHCSGKILQPSGRLSNTFRRGPIKGINSLFRTSVFRVRILFEIGFSKPINKWL